MPSADVRICWFCSHVLIDGRPIMNSSASTASVVIISMSVKPYGRLFMGSAIRRLLPHPARGTGVALVRHVRPGGDDGRLGAGLVHGERDSAEGLARDAVRRQHELLVV